MAGVETSYYLRMRVEDKPGVLADIAASSPIAASPSTR